MASSSQELRPPRNPGRFNFDFEPDPRNMQRNRICGVRPVGTAKPSAAA